MLGTLILFNDSLVNIVTITFTSLIFIELLNVFTEVNKIKFMMIVSVFFSLVAYVGSIVIMKEYF